MPPTMGPGADDGHLDHQVVEALRPVARQGRHLRPALHLEHPHGVRPLEHAVGLGVVRRQVGQVDVHPLVAADHRHHFLQGVEHAEPQQVDLDDPQIGAVVLVPLDHRAPLHGRRLQGHHLVQAAGGHDHAAGMLPQVPGQVLDALPQLREEHYPPLLGVEAGGTQLLAQVLVVAAAGVVAPAAELLRQAVHLVRGEPQGLGGLPGGALVPVGDDVGGHRRAVVAVAAVDVLDHLLPGLAGGQVQVDVRPLAALLGQEALEEQPHLHRVHGGDGQGVAHRAVGRRAPALDQHAAFQAEAHDVPDDQEIARQVELVDHPELFLDLRLGAGGEGPEAGPGAVPGELPQVGAGGLPGGQGVVREAVAQIRQGEVQLPGQLHAARQGPGQVGEQARHLGGALQVLLPVGLQAASGGVHVGVLADAGEHVVESLVPAPGVAHAVGGHEGQPQPPGQVQGGLQAVLLDLEAVALELHVDAAVEGGDQALQEGPRRRQPAGCEPPGQGLGVRKQKVRLLFASAGRKAATWSSCGSRKTARHYASYWSSMAM